jgi:hypothetical protein
MRLVTDDHAVFLNFEDLGGCVCVCLSVCLYICISRKGSEGRDYYFRVSGPELNFLLRWALDSAPRSPAREIFKNGTTANL